MIKPILWTVIAVITIVLSIISTGGGVWTYVLIFAALACVFLQWKVYFKNK